MSTTPRLPLSELEIVQNPAVGAYAIWQFTLGFQEEGGSAPLLPLAFLVLPLVLHRRTLDAVSSTRKTSGLSLFVAKLADQREDLLAVHDRALLLRRLTLQSIGVGVAGHLLNVIYDQATLRGYARHPDVKKPVIPERLKGLASAPEKLGYWFSKAGLAQVSSSLRIEF